MKILNIKRSKIWFMIFLAVSVGKVFPMESSEFIATTRLFEAVRGSEDTVAGLVLAGTDVSVMDNDGRAALDFVHQDPGSEGVKLYIVKRLRPAVADQ